MEDGIGVKGINGGKREPSTIKTDFKKEKFLLFILYKLPQISLWERSPTNLSPLNSLKLDPMLSSASYFE